MFCGEEQGSFLLLYCEEPKVKRVYIQEQCCHLIVQPFCAVEIESGENPLCLGVSLSDPKTGEFVSSWLFGKTLHRDIISCYRAAQVVAHLHLIYRKLLEEAWCACRTCTTSEERYYAQNVTTRLDQEAYEWIMSLTPPCLEDALLILSERGIRFDKDALEEEIRIGTLKLTPALKRLGIADPKQKESKENFLRRQVDCLYQPFIDLYLSENSLSEKASLREEIYNRIIEAIEQKFVEPDLILGCAIIRAQRLHTDIESLTKEQSEARDFCAVEGSKTVASVSGFLQRHSAEILGRFGLGSSRCSPADGRTSKEYLKLLGEIT